MTLLAVNRLNSYCEWTSGVCYLNRFIQPIISDGLRKPAETDEGKVVVDVMCQCRDLLYEGTAVKSDELREGSESVKRLMREK